jgi:carboxyl-terminal processing protease
MSRRLSALFGVPLVLFGCRTVPPSQTPASEPAPSTAVALPPLPAACGVSAADAASRADETAGDAVAIFDTAWGIIRRTHWDTTYNGVNWVALRDTLRPRAAAARTRGELRLVLSEMLGRLRQSHFSIIPQESADATGAGGGSADRSPGRAGGDQPGWLGFETRLLGGAMVVTQVDTGGPAWTAGVRTGWVLQAVDGCPTAARVARLPASLEPRRRALMASQMLNRSLGGNAGDTVHLQFADARDAARDLTLVQQVFPGSIAKFGNLPPMPAQLEWRRVKQDGRTVGVIRFNVWMPVLSPAFDAAMDSLRSSDAIVIDVRGNLGGVGGMSMGIAGHFLDTSVAIGVMKQRTSNLRFVANPRRVNGANQTVKPFAGPLAIVVDPLSASTTEIFAGGLQLLKRATIFGSQSAGQALPSVPERLPNGDILYHAIADFVGPTGKPVEGEGVIPDRVMPLTRPELLKGHDAALDAAVRWAAQQATRPIVP